MTILDPMPADDVQLALLDLYPPGDLYPRDPQSLRGKFVGAMADALARADERATAIVLRELDPRTATFMFPEWQALAGVATQATHQQTVDLIMQRIEGRGGRSIDYFKSLAAGLGITVEIVKHTRARCGVTHCGDQIGASPWAFTWDVVAAHTTVIRSRAGSARCGDPLRSWGNAELETLIRRFAPAKGVVRFLYQ